MGDHTNTPPTDAPAHTPGTPPLTCKEIIGFLDDYLSGEQDAAVREAFTEHIDGCPCCACYLEHYRKTIDAAKRCCCNRNEPPPEIPEHLVSMILRARTDAGGEA